jgi:hypothetical protein
MGIMGHGGIHPFYSQPAFLEVLSEAQNVHLQPLSRGVPGPMETNHSSSGMQMLHRLGVFGVKVLMRDTLHFGVL